MTTWTCSPGSFHLQLNLTASPARSPNFLANALGNRTTKTDGNGHLHHGSGRLPEVPANVGLDVPLTPSAVAFLCGPAVRKWQLLYRYLIRHVPAGESLKSAG